MEVLIKDSDVVSMVLEFLHSRKLYESAIALERETGVLPTLDGSLPEHLRYLRRLAIDGEWDNVLFYLEPFTELDEFDSRELNYLILRQKYIEILHEMSRNKTCSGKGKENLKKVVKEIQPYCSREELQQMQCVHASYLEESYKLATTRISCFKHIADVLGPFFDSYSLGATGDQSEHAANSQSDRTRLESVVTDSLLFNECCRYCRERATTDSDKTSETGVTSLSTETFNQSDYDSMSNAAVLFWIRSFKHDDSFSQRYEIDEVQVKNEPLKKQILSPNDEADSPRKFSSFASPKQNPKHVVMRPLVTQSVPSSERFVPSVSNHLTASGPSHHPHLASRNYSNNNNTSEENIDHHDSPLSETKSHDHKQENLVEDPQHFEVPEIKSSQQKLEISPKQQTNSSSPQYREAYPEKPLRDSSNLQNTKVANSYDKFLEDKRRRKNENQQFLKNLEEKEKKNDELRKILQHGGDAATVPVISSSHDSTYNNITKKDDQNIIHMPIPNQNNSAHRDVNGNTKSPVKSVYIAVEYTEDVQAIRAVSFHPSGQVYAVGSNSKILRICTVPKNVISRYARSPRSQKWTEEIKASSPKPSTVIAQRNNLHKGSIYCMAWNVDGSLIATGSNDKLVKTHGFDILGKTLDETSQEMSFHRGVVREVMFLHESSNTLSSGGSDGMVYISDCKHNKIIHNLAGHTDQVLSLYSWHHNMLASSSQDKTIRLWDIRTPSCVSIIGTGVQEPCIATSICVDNSGHFLAMGLDNSKTGIYDLSAGKMALEYKCHKNEVRSLRFNPVFENQLLSSSYDGTVVISDVDGLLADANHFSHEYHWNKVAECQHKLIQCKWHPNGETFATTSVDKTCKLWLRV